MATTTAKDQAAPQGAKPGPLKRILLIVIIAILAAGAAGAGVWFFMSRHPAAATASAPPPPPVPVYYALEPMTVNLQSDDGDTHYLRIGLTLKLDSQATQDALVAHMPEIRSRVLLALSNKHPSDLAPLDGKRALATELAALISQPSDPRGQPAKVEDVLFTEFVVQ
ncbi:MULTISPECIES: flagellar basal body-associated protein FliL [Paraburkholderia]|uniref:Flagellar protein FliL n=1 Tax=Paraburkholderia tropica TaxID=92647 RepID=A0A1A5WZT5_9BURK|nr:MULTISPECIES: flagellar basal body-associated protein FliL [Paraburkholderia]MBB2977856.1 flagellar FliL protein [Paraburkholderia tropica]MBB2998458.1 flagellar FliL protein [Paraburkholderia tropica]MBB6317500.1 flagellar FliL protein [Paraburkholderia tropica]MDE1142536.1 flagellar basal body-associated protein FliL [Paraburkholderia tropica]OBR46786.1 flagellar basal body-associated protein FliL [Paraburkholderia tropica]